MHYSIVVACHAGDRGSIPHDGVCTMEQQQGGTGEVKYLWKVGINSYPLMYVVGYWPRKVVERF